MRSIRLTTTSMRIACLAGGSLPWKPGALPMAWPWRSGGPALLALPLEFVPVGKQAGLAGGAQGTFGANADQISRLPL